MREYTAAQLLEIGAPLSGWHEILQIQSQHGMSYVIVFDPPSVPGKEGAPWFFYADSKRLCYSPPGAVVPHDSERDATILLTSSDHHHNWTTFGGNGPNRRATAKIAACALDVFEAIVLKGDKQWPGANLLCADCLCSNQKLSVDAFTFTFYCFALGSLKGIDLEPNQFKGSRVCSEQALRELADDVLGAEIREVLKDTRDAEWRLSDTTVLREIVASTMCHAWYVREDSARLFAESPLLLRLQEKVLGANAARAGLCRLRVYEAWRHFAAKGGIELDEELDDSPVNDH